MDTAKKRYERTKAAEMRSALREQPRLLEKMDELLSAIREKDSEIVKLKADVADLFQHNKELEARVSALEKRQ